MPPLAVAKAAARGPLPATAITWTELERGSDMKVGRSAKTGRFVTVKYANAHKSTAIVQTIKRSK